jgi:hypothetical protein
MDFYRKYKHIGNSYASVSRGWKPIVEKALVEIERKMWPRWIPMFIKRLIHYLATGNSIVRVKYHWAYKLRSKLTHSQMIQDIKVKYADLRIYGHFGGEIDDIIRIASSECDKTCETCGSRDNVKYTEETGWAEIACYVCTPPTRRVLIEKEW